jgi:pilus assembly protein CpaE
VLLDTPAVFYRTTLMAVSESDSALLVATSELPSLHQARRAVQLLANLGFDRDRFRVVINRVNRRDGIAPADLEKIFSCPVFASLPNDYFSLHRVVTLGHSLGFDCELGRAVEDLAGRLTGTAKTKRGGGGLVEASPALSQT